MNSQKPERHGAKNKIKVFKIVFSWGPVRIIYKRNPEKTNFSLFALDGCTHSKDVQMSFAYIVEQLVVWLTPMYLHKYSLLRQNTFVDHTV
jgi:hypothetical protein